MGQGPRLAKALEKIMYVSGLGSIHTETFEMMLQEENLSKSWFYVILFIRTII